MKLTDEQVDRMLSAAIPGGSQARDWFLPHEQPRGLENVRHVVRAMFALLAQETAASRATECEQKQPNTDSVHLAASGNSAACGDEAAALTACPSCGAQSDEEAGEMCFGEPCPMCFTDDWSADLAELNRRIAAADEGMPK